MKYGLKLDVINQIKDVFSKHPQIEKAILYGYRAKGNYRNGSDIDIALVGRKDVDLSFLYKVEDELDDLLLPYTFDIAILHYIKNKDLLEHINRVGIDFYVK